MTIATRRRSVLMLAVGVAACLSVAWALPQITDTTTRISADDLLDRVARGDALVLLDVRSEEEFAAGHVPGAVNIPHTEVGERIEEILAHGEVEVVVYCRSGRRAGIAENELREAGIGRLLHLDGDMLGWQARRLPVVRSSGPES